MDTRLANGPLGGPFLTSGATRAVTIPLSSCEIPIAPAYSLNITVVPRGKTLGYLTVWPTGQPQPLVATLNSLDGSILANAAIVPADATGSIDVFTTDEADLVIDINGYFAAPATGTLQFFPLQPCRVLDTRAANGAFGGPAITGGESRSFAIPASDCNVPISAAAYSLNVAVVPHGGLGYLTVWPSGQPQPLVATLNSLDGTILANAAIVPAGTDGAVSFFATDTTDLVVDINGYFAEPNTGGLNFHTVTPCRIVDTRNPNGPLGGPFLTGNTSRTFPLPSSDCGLPETAAAYSLNVAVVPQGPLGYLTAWPTGQAQPLVSTLNALKGLVIANAALVPSGTNGSIDVFVSDTTDIIIDTNGYFGQLTSDRTATFAATVGQMIVNDTTNVSVGDLVTGRPSTVNNLIVSAGGLSMIVPNTAQVAVGEVITGVDAATGVQLFAAGTVVVAIASFDANTNVVTFSNPTGKGSGQASVTFNASPFFAANTVVVKPAPNASGQGQVNVSPAPVAYSGPGIVNPAVVGSPGVTVRFTEPITQDRTATFDVESGQIIVDNIANIAVGYLVNGRPFTVNNVVVSAGSSTFNVPNTAQVAVNELVTATDPATGVGLFRAGSAVVGIMAFDANTNTVTISSPSINQSAQARVIFDASPLIPNGTFVINPPPNSAGQVNISAKTAGASGPGIVNHSVIGSPGVTVRFTQQ